MNRLLEIGFKRAGAWSFVNAALAYQLDDHAKMRNILYAFVSGAEVKYIGKTVQTSATRLIGYRTPAAGQPTNQRNHAKIVELLQAGQAVDIYALADSGLLRYGQFHLNLAAGLEDSLIAVIDPDWNGGRRARDVAEEMPVPVAEPVAADATFELTVGPTYYEQGFFNVPVHAGDLFGVHGQTIEIFCGDNTEPLLGIINRTANNNSSPRIMGRRHLRDWFRDFLQEGEIINVEVNSPTSIHLRR